MHAGIHTPPGQTSLGRHPPGRHPWADTPPRQTPLCQVHAGIHTPLPSACWDRHGYCCGRYASYWNAFLFSSGSWEGAKGHPCPCKHISLKNFMFLAPPTYPATGSATVLLFKDKTFRKMICVEGRPLMPHKGGWCHLSRCSYEMKSSTQITFLKWTQMEFVTPDFPIVKMEYLSSLSRW